ncbi:MAG: ABC transporter substrate-binding protein, partial [Clostridia bacterium]
DIIEYGWNAYPGGVQKAIDDQIIIDLTDMLADNAPNYNAFFQKQPELAKQVKTDDGKVCVFAAFSISDYNVQSGYVIR